MRKSSVLSCSIRTATTLTVLAGAGLIGGCAAAELPFPAANAPTDAVLVDFYQAGVASAACSGTLLSPNVVLTSAHCTNGASAGRVKTAGGEQAQTVEIAQVVTYDWGLTADHAQEHDLALVVLRKPINFTRYAAVNADATPGQKGVFYGRNGSTSTLTADWTSPTGRPFALNVFGASAGAVSGSGMRDAEGALVGIYMGRGQTSNTVYVARIDMAEVQIWMRNVVSLMGNTLARKTQSSRSGTLNVKNTGSSGGPPTDDVSGPDSSSDGSKKPGTPKEEVGDDTRPNPEDPPGDTPKPFDTEDNLSPDKKFDVSFAPNGQLREKGDNYWVSSEPGDAALINESSYAARHPDATVVSAHGTPGMMADYPDKATVKDINKDRTGPLIAGACYAGTPGSASPSVASRLAETAGVDRSRAWGCTGTSTTAGNGSSMSCDGSWVDGNGRAVSTSNRTTYGLQNCRVKSRSSSGGWTDYKCS
jgi:Trypsin